jgi:hypothetical protein
MSEQLKPSLDERLARLPREIAPARDLWPAIEARLLRRARRQRQFALAIAAGLATTALALFAAYHPHLPQQPDGAARRLAQAFDSEGPRGAAFLRTRAALEQSFATDLEKLPPKTRARLLQDLEIIRSARADIRSALDSSPQDPMLNELLADTWQQEMNFYANVSLTPDSARLRWPL